MTVLCLVEYESEGPIDASLRALTFARSFGQSSGEALAVAVVGSAGQTVLGELSSYAVSDVYAIESDELDSYAPAGWARALVELVSATSASAIVAAGTDRGNEVMAHVGALTGLAMVANCLTASRSGPTTVRLSRQRWAGSLIEPAPTGASTAVHVHHPSLSDQDLRVKVSQWLGRSAGISLADARVVVGGGRGVGGPEGFAPIEELAALLGAAVGVSRVVTSLGWRSHNQQVGQTGTRISPDLYLACGISGAIQHLAGCQSAKHVVAINTDPDAPIISRADYAVIGDLNTIIPALVTAIRARSPGGAGET